MLPFYQDLQSWFLMIIDWPFLNVSIVKFTNRLLCFSTYQRTTISYKMRESFIVFPFEHCFITIKKEIDLIGHYFIQRKRKKIFTGLDDNIYIKENNSFKR